ncbi:MAG TPA: 2Fe-2S iron-sulfur cluster-binding protein [Acidimicrobiales bacterium]|nr:2Fe-2S iron-sulfur cluster-binding protein [Acidimicrobiales bacterium]
MIQLHVNGAGVEVPDDGSSLLDVLRDRLGLHSVKDGCSPQGQCGCCTVWVDGAPRVACVTPVRRLQGRRVTTLEALPGDGRAEWAEALVATGGSQCGFCTPGIVMRLAALAPEPAGRGAGSAAATAASGKVGQALVAHLCRCTGWQTIEEAAARVYRGSPGPGPPVGAARDLGAAAARAELEGGVPQQVGPDVVLGRAGFADDTCPAGALVAVPDGRGGHAVAESLSAARALAGKVQGRRTSAALSHPIAVPPGAWTVSLRTTWVEPAYVEPDASWCVPGGVPASPYGNGGAFGGKLHSPVTADARRLADEHGRPVRVLWSREDVVRHGPKRPPVAGGIDAGGTGVLRVGITEGGVTEEEWASVSARVAAVAPGLLLEQVPLAGPAISFDLRAAVWAEAAVLAAVTRRSGSDGPGPRHDVPIEVVGPSGGRAVARCHPDGSIEASVDAGPPLDEVVLRSYCIGAAHQALGWVRSEGIAVDAHGAVQDLTVRSFGILQARAMPPVTVRIGSASAAGPVNGSDAVFAAVAAARWLADGLAPEWPCDRGGAGRR